MNINCARVKSILNKIRFFQIFNGKVVGRLDCLMVVKVAFIVLSRCVLNVSLVQSDRKHFFLHVK